MGPLPPDETVRHALRRLGENGARAERFLDSAAEHLTSDTPLAAQHAAFAVREALMWIVKLGGQAPRGMKEAAEEVVRRWRGHGPGERLADSIRQLGDVLDGPGPNALRLERAVRGLSRVAPTRATADLLDQFVIVLRDANNAAHADTPPQGTAVTGIYERACVVLRDLFGPVSERLADMEDLVGLLEPGHEDVPRLKERLGEEHRLPYLFDQADGPGWFRALREDDLLLPPPDGPWPAGPYMARIANTHPDEVRDWLRSLRDLNAKQVGDALRLARMINGDVADVVLTLARDHLGAPDVRFQVDAVLRQMPPEQRDTETVRALLHWSLRHTLGDRQAAGDTFMASGQLEIAVKAAAGNDPGGWLMMLAHRAREVAEQAEPLRMRLMLPVSELSLQAARRPLELVSVAVLQAAAASANAGLPLAERLDRLRLLPDPLATRLIAQHLQDQLPTTADDAREFIAVQIATNDQPSPEELALLRRLFDDEVTGVNAAVAAALGKAPNAAPTADVPAASMRAHRWLVAVPESVAPEWHQADVVITEQAGAASQDGVMMRVGRAQWVGESSPVALDDLIALSPLEAAERVAAWRPDPAGSFFGPSAEGLAGTLRQAINSDPARWIEVDPVELAHALRYPVYINVLLQALSERAEDLVPMTERIVTLVELVRSEPWPVEDLGSGPVGYEESWTHAADEAIKLLRRLGDLGTLQDDAVAERAWDQVIDAFRHRGDMSPYVDDQEHDPVSRAINRPSMRALEAAFSLGEDADHVPNEKFLSLLDEALGLEGVDGLHSRAMLAVRLPHLRHVAQAWFADREDRIFGDTAPDQLGPATFDLYLEWGRPYGPLLREQRDRVIDALAGERHEDATQHLLHGLLWRLTDFDAAAVADILIEAGPAVVSYAGRWLGWALADADDVDMTPVIELWEELLGRHLESGAYRGFGWMAVNGHIDEDSWLNLMQETAIATSGHLNEPDRIVERAAQASADPRAARIVARLLEGDPQPWELDRIGSAGLELLGRTTDADASSDLRESLLARGFYDAGTTAT